MSKTAQRHRRHPNRRPAWTERRERATQWANEIREAVDWLAPHISDDNPVYDMADFGDHNAFGIDMQATAWTRANILKAMDAAGVSFRVPCDGCEYDPRTPPRARTVLDNDDARLILAARFAAQLTGMRQHRTQ